jgi:HAE1 family hydrophobic/amphiphilic exporter-1
VKIVDVSVARPVSITMLVLIVVVVGFMSLGKLGLDLMPDLDFPTLSVMTRYEGASSEDVEKLVTRPIEAAVATVQGVTGVKSVSQEDTSYVMVDFEWGTNLDEAANDMREAIGLVAPFIPEAAEDPLVVKFSLTAFPVLGYGVRGMGGNTVQLRRFLEDVFIPRLERLDGVAQAALLGGDKPEVQVRVDRAALEASGLRMDQVVQALFAQNMDLPAGRLVEAGQEFLIRTRGAFSSIDSIGDAVVGAGSGGAPLRLRDVAEVGLGAEDRRNVNRTNGEESVFLMVAKQSGANPLQVARRVKKEVAALSEDLGGSVQFDLFIDTGYQIERMADNVTESGIAGGLLTILFMWLFLRSLRPVFAIATTIPVSMLATLIPLYFMGETLNLMTMGGLMLGIGMFVDNAVVVIENVYRHLEEGKERHEAARKGAAEVGLAIAASTATTIAVFVPLFFGGGLAGELVRGLAWVVVFSMSASLLMALTMVPMLASVLFNRKAVERQRQQDARFVRFQRQYERVLRWALAHRKATLGIVGVSVLLSFAAMPFLGAQFLPGSDQPIVMGKVKFPVGTPMVTTERAMERIEALARAMPEVMTVGIGIGANEDDMGAGMSEVSPAGVHEAQVFIRLKEERARDANAIMDDLRAQTPPVGGMKVEWMDMATAMMAGGSAKPVDIQVLGEDIDTLDRLSQEIAAAVQGVPGLVEIDTTLARRKPEQHLVVDREAAASYGLTVAEVARAVETASLGAVAGLYRSGGDEYPIRVRYDASQRAQILDLGRVQVPTRMGFAVPLTQVASFVPGTGPVQITREEQTRRVSVRANIQGRDLGSVVGDIQEILDGMKDRLPPGYVVTFGGTYEDMMDAFVKLGLGLLMAIVLTYMVMAAQFEAFVHPLVMMLCVPLSAVGVVGALLVTGTPASAVTFVGAIILVGIVVNNGIVLIDYINQLRREGMERREAVVRGSAVRLRPVLITAGTTVTALIPMAIAPGRGAELTGDLSVVIAAGLTTSTFLTLLVVPVVYEIFDSFGTKWADRIEGWFHFGEKADEGDEELPPGEPEAGPAAEPAEGRSGTAAAGAAAVLPLLAVVLGLGLGLGAAMPREARAQAPAEVAPLVGAPPLSLRAAAEATLSGNPSLRAAAELPEQAKASRDRALALILPQLTLGGQYRNNDREIALDWGDSLGGSGLDTAFESLFGNLGFIYGELFENGMIDAEECNEIAELNGFADCAAMVAAMESGQDLSGGASSGSSEPIVIQPKEQWFLQAQAQWPLSPRVVTLMQAGQRQVEMAGEQERQARQQALLGVVRGYAAAYAAQEAADLVAAQLDLLDHHVRQVEAFRQVGLATEDALLRARLEGEKLRRQLRQAQQAARVARRGIATAMAVDDGSFGRLLPMPAVLLSRELPESRQHADPGDVDGMTAEALERRPETRIAAAGARASRILKTDAGLRWLPSIALMAAWNTQAPAAGFDGRAGGWYLGAGAQWTLWDGGILVQDLREANSRRRQADAQLEAVRAQVSTDVRNAVDAWQVARQATPVAQQEVDLARGNQRLVQVRYDAGAATQVEVLDALAALRAAELGLLQSRVQEQVAAAELLASAGRLGKEALAD